MQTQRHHPRRRLRHPAAPGHAGVSKQLLPVYDKPMIYYPLSTLMLAGMRDVLVISTPQDTPRFQQLLGDGSQWGMNLQYACSPARRPGAGLHHRPRSFIGGAPSALVLGDNIFYGHDFAALLARADARKPRRHGVRLPRARPRALRRGRVRRQRQGLSIEEKPRQPKSNYAVTGLYFYDEQVVRHRQGRQAQRARRTGDHRASTSAYLEQGQLNVQIMGRGYAWLDTGTHDSLLEAGQFIATLERARA
jgi:glucose-1-phosphate thymidylyltransferase